MRCTERDAKEMNGSIMRVEARQKLRVSAPVFNALVTSELLGVQLADGRLRADGIEHYQWYGTQWQTIERFGAMGTRVMPDSLYQSPPPTPIKGVQPPDTGTHVFIARDDVPEDAVETDTGWLAQFYLVPNYYFFPNPLDLAMIGSVPLKLDAPKKVRGASLPAYLYPDPSGSLAMVSVFGREGRADSAAHRVAYDVAIPILDELAVKYDVPLPIVQTVIVGVPSGLIHVFYPKHSAIQRLERGEAVEPRCPYPQLLDAAALYREGVSSNNPFHRFLVFWKVYEEAVHVRGDWRRKHKRKDVRVQEEVVPDLFAFGAKNEELAPEYQTDEAGLEERSFRGLNFEEARQRLNRPYRVALAHAGDVKGGKPLTAATGEEFTDVSGQVPLVRYMARVVLENVRATLASSEESKG